MPETLPCGCCAGGGQETPALIDNLPGLASISYRTGTWETFTKLYPPDHMDGPKARPLFAAFKPAQKKRCIARLLVYLSSDRWKKSPQYIPLASNWLKSAYEEPPPPFYEVGKGGKRKGFVEEVMDEFKRQFDEYGEVL